MFILKNVQLHQVKTIIVTIINKSLTLKIKSVCQLHASSHKVFIFFFLFEVSHLFLFSVFFFLIKLMISILPIAKNGLWSVQKPIELNHY